MGPCHPAGRFPRGLEAVAELSATAPRASAVDTVITTLLPNFRAIFLMYNVHLNLQLVGGRGGEWDRVHVVCKTIWYPLVGHHGRKCKQTIDQGKKYLTFAVD